MKILAISGSVRAASINAMLLRVMAEVAPIGIEVSLYRDLGRLPIFNPDVTALPPLVAVLRDQLLAADAVVIASPEYAHGVSGAIKNGLDWMVGSESLIDKPVALLNAAPRASHAYASLREIVSVMSARVVDAASITLPLLGANLSEQAMRTDPQLCGMLHAVLLALKEGFNSQP